MSAPRPILFGEPWFDEDDERAVLETLRSAWVGQGPVVERFEESFAGYLGAGHVVAVSSCTAALELALRAAGVGPGDEVLTTPFTFVATITAIERTGATPVLLDVERDSLSLSPAVVERALGPRTRAVVPVHFGGWPLDTLGFARLADEHDLWIVEDAAHAVAAVAGGMRVGGSGHPRVLTCFSFYPNKNLASAEGGAVALARPELAERLKSLRLHGLGFDAWDRYRRRSYTPTLAQEPGMKANWTDLQAALALSQLQKLEGLQATREYLAERYDELLAGISGVAVRSRGPGGLHWRHALHLYQVEVSSGRDELVDALRRQGIGAAVHYIGIDRHPAFAGRFPGPYPVSAWASDSLVSLPLSVRMGDEEVQRVADAIAAEIDSG